LLLLNAMYGCVPKSARTTLEYSRILIGTINFAWKMFSDLSESCRDIEIGPAIGVETERETER